MNRAACRIPGPASDIEHELHCFHVENKRERQFKPCRQCCRPTYFLAAGSDAERVVGAAERAQMIQHVLIESGIPAHAAPLPPLGSASGCHRADRSHLLEQVDESAADFQLVRLALD